MKRILICGALVFAGCAELNDPNYSSPYGSGYNNGGYYGGGYNDSGYRRDDWARHEKRELNRERDRLEEERERLERERERERERREADRYRAPPPPPPPAREERCPSGFSPSEQKCSREERKHGCRDMRLPGGLGCVDR